MDRETEGRRAPPARRSCHAAGFTLIELLVVISIIALLLSLLLPSASASVQRAKRIRCMSNMRNLQTAYINYAQSKHGELPSANTTSSAWVLDGNTIAALTNGVLYDYVKDIRPYRCGSGQLHLYRSFSINGYLNGEWAASGARTYTAIRYPARTIVFIEECDLRGYLMGSFIANSGSWIDYVAVNHRNGDNFSFADGHMEYRTYVSPDTYGISGHGTAGKGNADLQWIAARLWPK
jgi:prepilin-type N-terminal cleavage/methylation domain-containing protein